MIQRPGLILPINLASRLSQLRNSKGPNSNIIQLKLARILANLLSYQRSLQLEETSRWRLILRLTFSRISRVTKAIPKLAGHLPVISPLQLELTK